MIKLPSPEKSPIQFGFLLTIAFGLIWMCILFILIKYDKENHLLILLGRMIAWGWIIGIAYLIKGIWKKLKNKFLKNNNNLE